MPRGFDSIPSGSNLSAFLLPVALQLCIDLKRWRDSEHPYHERSVCGNALARYYSMKFSLKIEDSGIRACVNYLRREGYPIASSVHGYRWAVAPEELTETLVQLMNREIGIRAARKGLEGAMTRMKQPSLFSEESHVDSPRQEA